MAAGDLARSTLAGYRDELKRHILPVFGTRQIASITPDDLVRWHRDMQRRGLSSWSIKHAWAPLRLGCATRYATTACRATRPTLCCRRSARSAARTASAS